MDPDAAYEALSAAMHALRRHVDADVGDPPLAIVDDAVTHWDALNGWLAKGGYLPDGWDLPTTRQRAQHGAAVRG